MTMTGYGIVVSKLRLKDNAAECLVNESPLAFSEVAQKILREIWDDEYDKMTAQQMVEKYQNDTFMWRGIWGLLADTFNEALYAGRNVFYYEDQCLFVSDYIPKTQWDRMILPTVEEIETLLRNMIPRLVEVRMSDLQFTRVEIDAYNS